MPNADRARLLRAGWVVFWRLALPLVLALLFVLVVFPIVTATDAPPWIRGLGRLRADHFIPLLVAAFLAFSALVSYWASRHPRPDPTPSETPGLHGSARPADRSKPSPGLVAAIVAAGLAGLIWRTSVAESYRVSSSSMLPTLLPGDRVGVNKLAFGVQLPFANRRMAEQIPKRGDVVVFRSLFDQGGPPELVKRVVGLPGDEIGLQGGRLVLNGRRIPSCQAGSFTFQTEHRFTFGRLEVEFMEGAVYLTVGDPKANFGPYRVRPGEVFVLGDNRGLSNDSRTWNRGSGAGVPLAAILGRTNRIVSSVNADGSMNWSRLWRPLAPEVHIAGLDVQALQAGIRRCLEAGPESPSPPLNNLSGG